MDLLPNIKSAKKRVKITKKKRLRNRSLKSAFKTALRKVDAQKSESVIRAIRALDKAVTKGILHRNNAARKKSRLTKMLQV